MISSAYITPHSPILIPNIGKKNISILKRTTDAFLEIKDKIKNNKIDTIVIFSSHTSSKNSEIEINSHFQHDINFEEFGDYFSRLSFSGDIKLAYKIKESVEKEIKIKLFAENKIDYSSAIPLYLMLSEENQRINSFKGKILTINASSQKNIEHHFNFGKKISNLLTEEKKNILLISSAELSHRLSHRSPGGYYQKAEAFDNKVVELIKKKQEGVSALININEKTRIEVKECGLKSIAMLLGVINDKEYQPETLAYQKDLGIGYLTMDMGLKQN